MKAREYTSPLIEKLLSEVTPEEMEKTEQLMEAINNKQQTAVEWLQKTLRHNSISIFSGNIADQAKNLEQVFQQAKEMEKERELNAYANGQADTLLMFKQKISKMKDIPTEFNQIISENFWDLI